MLAGLFLAFLFQGTTMLPDDLPDNDVHLEYAAVFRRPGRTFEELMAELDAEAKLCANREYSDEELAICKLLGYAVVPCRA